MDDSRNNLILIGFSGTGKSTVGRLLAERLGWRFRDIDVEISQREGQDIASVFASLGENHFRHCETELLSEALAGDYQVVSTGGGAVLRPENRQLMRASGFVVCLECQPELILQRLRRQSETTGEEEVRPLLLSEAPLLRIRELKRERQALYADCDCTVHTDGLTVEEVVEEVHRALARAGKAASPRDGEGPVSVKTRDGFYHVMVTSAGLSKIAPTLLGRFPRLSGEGAARLFVVLDENVERLYAPSLASCWQQLGRQPAHFTIAAGEDSKSLGSAQRLYTWLIEQRAERRDLLLAIGGGVIGDLTGFVGATYLRGIDYVQVPTSLLAMVDSSVGGKTAVNHALGKNLIGCFYPPALVLADTSLLATLPARQLATGMAEVIKHAMIADPELFAELESLSGSLVEQPAAIQQRMVQRNVWLKANVVAADEREGGSRVILNYGHTAGHGFESASNYQLSHGEAVAYGMLVAAELSCQMGLLSRVNAERQAALLRRHGLAREPLHKLCDAAQVIEAMRRDKKIVQGNVRWVLAEGIGKVRVVRDVPQEMVKQALGVVMA